MKTLQGRGVTSLALEGRWGGVMKRKKRILDFIIELLEKHGECVLTWNGVTQRREKEPLLLTIL